MGCVFDSFAEHMRDQDPLRTFLPLEKESTREQIIEELRDSAAEMLVNYLPVGSEQATRVSTPVARWKPVSVLLITFPSSSPAIRFGQSVLPTKICLLSGTTSKRRWAQLMLHRTIVDLFRKRGVKVVQDLSAEHRRQHRFSEHA